MHYNTNILIPRRFCSFKFFITESKLSVQWHTSWNTSFDLFALFVPKTILNGLTSLDGVEPHDVTPCGVVYFQSAMLSALLIYFKQEVYKSTSYSYDEHAIYVLSVKIFEK